MIQRKICMLGGFSVGKTSLTRRFVSSMFDDKYLTTVGVKVDKKVVNTSNTDMTMMIWDLAGEDEYSSIKSSYLRGASGYLLVVDPTRPNTCETALKVHANAQEVLGPVPSVLALNKLDLKDDWLLDQAQIDQLHQSFTILETSAKSGANVEALFAALAEEIL